MKLTDLTVPTTATMQLQSQDGAQMLDIFITAYTPDAKQWRQAFRKHSSSAKGHQMQFGKKGTMTMEVPNDPNAYANRIKALAEVVTNIEGIDGWTYSPEAVLELFSNDGCAWIVDQLEDFMAERSNFLGKAAQMPSHGSEA